MKSSLKSRISAGPKRLSLIAAISLAYLSFSSTSRHNRTNRTKSPKSRLPLRSSSASAMISRSCGRFSALEAKCGNMSVSNIRSSLYSISPLPSSSCSLNFICSSCVCSSVKPASAFRSSLAFSLDFCTYIAKWEASEKSKFAFENFMRPNVFKASIAASAVPPWSLYTSVACRVSLSRYLRMIFLNSSKLIIPEPVTSTSSANFLATSNVIGYPSIRNMRATSLVCNLPVFLVSILLKISSNSCASARASPSRLRYASHTRHRSSKLSSSIRLPMPASSAASRMAR
mmetsp:Transcript_12132/g.27462  ORF Transcript_12132/g.27462 Transcript_12132/m.27462 type:complete len:287 (+) Transcript_12132:268-1128(+)